MPLDVAPFTINHSKFNISNEGVPPPKNKNYNTELVEGRRRAVHYYLLHWKCKRICAAIPHAGEDRFGHDQPLRLLCAFFAPLREIKTPKFASYDFLLEADRRRRS